MVRLMALVNISYKEVGRSNLIDQKCGFSLTRLILILNETLWGVAVVDYSVKVKSLWPGAFQWRIYYHRMCGQLSTTCSNLLK